MNGDIKKQPKWVQARIAKLESRNKVLNHKVRALNELLEERGGQPGVDERLLVKALELVFASKNGWTMNGKDVTTTEGYAELSARFARQMKKRLPL